MRSRVVILRKGFFLLTKAISRLLCRAMTAFLVTGMAAATGCATYPGLGGGTGQSTGYDAASKSAAAPDNPARTAAVAEIRAGADAAAAASDGRVPNVFQSYGPTGDSVMTRAERLAVEAELEAVLAAQAQASSPAEVARLKARAVYLKKLAGSHAAQAEADIQANSEAAN